MLHRGSGHAVSLAKAGHLCRPARLGTNPISIHDFRCRVCCLGRRRRNLWSGSGPYAPCHPTGEELLA
jgi:hypothetical protein